MSHILNSRIGNDVTEKQLATWEEQIWPKEGTQNVMNKEIRVFVPQKFMINDM